MSDPAAAPTFSIGIPNYERPRYLKEALQNVLAQSFADFEVVVSDDCSRADIAAVVAQFDDPRVRFVRQAQNIGAVANFNYVINAARGRYIVLHQNDDLLHPDFLLRAHDAFQQAPQARTYAACVWTGNPEQGLHARTLSHLGSAADVLKGGPFELDGNAFAAQLLVSLPITFPAVAIEASHWHAIGGYFSEFELGADQITLCRAVLNSRLLYDVRIGAIYRAHSNQTSRASAKKDKKHFHVLTLQKMIGDMEKFAVPWQQHTRDFASQASLTDLRAMLRESVIFRADARLVCLLWDILRQHKLGHGRRELLKLGRKLRPGGLAYFLTCLAKR